MFKKVLFLLSILTIVITYFIYLNLTDLKFNNLIKLNSSEPEINRVYLVKPKHSVCSDQKNILWIGFVAIAPHLFSKRQLIRETWANKTIFPGIKLIFSTGLSKNGTINELIEHESVLHNDVLQLNFNDSYGELAFKVLNSYKWAAEYCNGAAFVLRINDDVVLNTFAVNSYLNKTKKNNDTNTMYGNILFESVVYRDVGNRFYVSFEQFDKPYFYPYGEGSAHIVTMDLAVKLYELSIKMPPKFPLEDAYFGILLKELSSKLVNIVDSYVPTNQYNYFSLEYKLDLIKNKQIDSVLFIYEGSRFDFYWDYIKRMYNVL